jgi:hypothetical protein
MNRKWVVSALCAVILAACAPSAPSTDAISTAIAQTQAAIPTATLTPVPTKIPIDEINLEALLILPGDLPAQFEGQQIRSHFPERLNGLGIPEGINTASQSFRNDEWASDGVTITIYKSADEAKTNFTDNLNNKLPKVDGLGDDSLINEEGTLCDRCSMQIIFIRCNALVYVDIFNELADRDAVYETITTYAKRLDKRLQPLVCE